MPCWWYSLCIHLVGVNRLICMSRVLWCGYIVGSFRNGKKERREVGGEAKGKMHCL